MANPFVHIELHTDNTSSAKGFYSELFDWSMDDMPMGDAVYTMLGMGEDEVTGGITQKMCPDTPPNWLAYVKVDDVDSVREKAKALGAEIGVEKVEMPHGCFSVLKDPSGAAFAIWQSAE